LNEKVDQLKKINVENLFEVTNRTPEEVSKVYSKGIDFQMFQKVGEELSKHIEIERTHDGKDIVSEIRFIAIKNIIPLFKFLRDNYEQYPITKEIYHKLVDEI